MKDDSGMGIDLNKENQWRKHFSHFDNRKNNNNIFLDNAGTTLKLRSVINYINKSYINYSLNPHSISENKLFKEINNVFENTRGLIIELIGGNYRSEAVFTPSATYSFNLLALACKSWLKKGDEIGLTYLEHSSNYYPWKSLAEEIGIKIIFLPLTPTGQINLSKLKKCINSHTKIISFFFVSNSLGTINPVFKISKIVKKKNPDCLIVVDACQSIICNQEILVNEWEVDVLIFSPHKMYGPTGLGVMWINHKIRDRIPSVLWGGGRRVPSTIMENDRSLPYYCDWEVGTPPVAQVFGLYASLKWLRQQKRKKIISWITNLTRYTIRKLLTSVPEIILYSQKNKRKTGIITFNLSSFHAHDVVDYLSRNGIITRGGDFCCPNIRMVLNTSFAIRISLSIYNTFSEVDKLIFYLSKIKNYSLLVL